MITDEEKAAAKSIADALPDDVYDGASCLMHVWMQLGHFRVEKDLTIVLHHSWIGSLQSATDFLHGLDLCRFSSGEADGAHLTPAGLYVLSPIYLDEEERLKMKLRKEKEDGQPRNPDA